MNWATQLYLNSEYKKKYSLGTLEKKLSRILQSPGLTRLLFWNTREDPYTDLVIKLCRDNNIECWLWFPVLADTLIDADQSTEAVNHRGDSGVCGPGCMALSGEGDEDFSFVCPSDRSFWEKTESHLRTILESHDFDGVFLDRIRFPSFANGLPMLFSCLCPVCCRRMKLDKDALVREWESMTGEDFLKILCAPDSEGHGNRDFPLIREFLDRRSSLITEKAEGLIRIARNNGLGTALDLFTPSLARAVGQDYKSLSSLVDWIKPMTYAKAWGPAGIPLELDCFFRGVSECFPELEKRAILHALENLMDFPLSNDWEQKSKNGFSSALAFMEWEKSLAYESSGCRFYPGIEFVHSELFQTKISSDSAIQSVKLFRDKTEIIACWNCLEIPESYFTILDQG